jgi:non-specific serine/threonine protein kinase/serine/threonine-protein kinase
MMTPERWRQIKELLGPALDLDPAKQTEYLDQACGNDRSLRMELERLLAAERDASPEFLNAPALPAEFMVDLPQRVESWIGRRLGSYEIVEELGFGGMGEVYRAVRADDEFRKQVAVKLVRSGQDSSFILNRFRNERQILASLDHPNIARLLDGGTTEEGVPYFVMELVEGRRIDEFCDAHNLKINERLELFLPICSAVQYAHQRLIVHRDIKPGNILVTADGVPKLLDFGIAKILESNELEIQPEQTIGVFRLLTPEYASPEQVRSEPVTTASDVYSLGVVLYELLTCRTPYRVATRTPHEISVAVCETEPEKPSSAVRRQLSPPNVSDSAGPSTKETSPANHGALEKLSKSLRGDLDNIILMALRKEPLRRYASVEQFAGDIRRYLTKLPVLARKDTASYRASKFISRNKAGVASAALVTVALLTALGVTLREARIARSERVRAERRFSDVRKLANSLMFEIHDSIKDLPGSTPSRKLLVSRALEYLDSLSQEAKGDPSLQRELAVAYDKIGDVQGQPRQANLGDSAGAESSYRKSLAILEPLVAANSKALDLRRELVQAYGKLSDLLWFKGDFAGTMENSRKGLAVAEEAYRADPANPANRLLLATYRMDYGFKQALVAGDRAGGLETLHQGSEILEQIVSADPQNMKARRLLGLSYGRAAAILQENASDYPQALALYGKAVATTRALLAADPNNTDFARMAAYDQFQMAQLLANMGDLRSALLKERESLSSFQKLAAADPANLQFRQDLAQVRGQIGEILTQQGDLPNALTELSSSLDSLESVPDAKIPQTVAGLAYVWDQYRLGEIHARMASSAKTLADKAQHCKEAESWFHKCLPGFKILRDHASPQNAGASPVDDIEKQIARCERVLEKKAPSPSP